MCFIYIVSETIRVLNYVFMCSTAFSAVTAIALLALIPLITRLLLSLRSSSSYQNCVSGTSYIITSCIQKLYCVEVYKSQTFAHVFSVQHFSPLLTNSCCEGSPAYLIQLGLRRQFSQITQSWQNVRIVKKLYKNQKATQISRGINFNNYIRS